MQRVMRTLLFSLFFHIQIQFILCYIIFKFNYRVTSSTKLSISHTKNFEIDMIGVINLALACVNLMTYMKKHIFMLSGAALYLKRKMEKINFEIIIYLKIIQIQIQ